MGLLDIIPTGKENAVSGEYLCQLTGYSDRMLRKEVQLINETGEAIICRENKRGYYLPETPEEAERYIRYSQSYLVTLARKDRAMKKAKDKMFSNQMELKV